MHASNDRSEVGGVNLGYLLDSFYDEQSPSWIQNLKAH